MLHYRQSLLGYGNCGNFVHCEEYIPITVFTGEDILLLFASHLVRAYKEMDLRISDKVAGSMGIV